MREEGVEYERKVSEGPWGSGLSAPRAGVLARVPHRSDGVAYTEKPDLMWGFNTRNTFKERCKLYTYMQVCKLRDIKLMVMMSAPGQMQLNAECCILHSSTYSMTPDCHC